MHLRIAVFFGLEHTYLGSFWTLVYNNMVNFGEVLWLNNRFNLKMQSKKAL